jgi:aspartyl-tRNA(Asn)/glutamyl-tRNA(Gln) amidotransferase subunit A
VTLDPVSPLSKMQRELASGEATPATLAAKSLEQANGNASQNTYLWLSESWLQTQATALEYRFQGKAKPPLYGIPVSLKDCFDLADAPTSAGTRFYADRLGVAARDSVMAERLKAAGMLITGKTHLHPLAYGITGENPDYGDCLQPRDSTLLTGGSSSGAVASVQEGSAVIAIGTDTGGSVRVPAALCGLVGYRMSHRLAFEPGRWSPSEDGLWTGGIHLSQSFDTVGVFVRDPRDLAPAVSGIFGLECTKTDVGSRIGCVTGEFLSDCDTDVLTAMKSWQASMANAGCVIDSFEPEGWEDGAEIFAAIQAHEAAGLHRDHYEAFEPAIAQRLKWGAAITEEQLAELRDRMRQFRERLLMHFERFDFILLPCAPVRQLFAGQDHSEVRPRILKYTTPFSLAGVPVLALPGECVGGALGSGVQLAARPGEDGRLLGLATLLGNALA